MSPLPLAGVVAVSAGGEGALGCVSPTSYRPTHTCGYSQFEFGTAARIRLWVRFGCLMAISCRCRYAEGSKALQWAFTGTFARFNRLPIVLPD